ncbi:hypothetical protein HOLleu_30121 [Holothuria leucospilota]|uniref:Uncharacterized protein n=1 Tax=Holothuria leucospilota TaxID=206669 RepID=A0A9Q1GWF2_HOLLE|nr:hypothetical protein HOLleu_30121 [Holothuria leucospilota]
MHTYNISVMRTVEACSYCVYLYFMALMPCFFFRVPSHCSLVSAVTYVTHTRKTAL